MSLAIVWNMAKPSLSTPSHNINRANNLLYRIGRIKQYQTIKCHFGFEIQYASMLKTLRSVFIVCSITNDKFNQYLSVQTTNKKADIHNNNNKIIIVIITGNTNQRLTVAETPVFVGNFFFV